MRMEMERLQNVHWQAAMQCRRRKTLAVDQTRLRQRRAPFRVCLVLVTVLELSAHLDGLWSEAFSAKAASELASVWQRGRTRSLSASAQTATPRWQRQRGGVSWLPYAGEKDEREQRQRRSSELQALVLPGALVAANLLPPCLGFWRSEYGVSYGYGLATGVSGWLLLRLGEGSLPWPVALHALCLCVYGARLTLFLLYRELCIPRFREVRNRIEDRAKKRGSRAKRFPFLASCALLYLGLAAPVALAVAAADLLGPMQPYKISVIFMCIGFLIAALGDLWKSVAKAVRGDDALVVGGPYAVLRHPNYTGEQLLWSANFLAGVLACRWLPWKASVGPNLSGLELAIQ